MGLRSLLLRIPPLRRWAERRWITDPVERAVHNEVVRGRLDTAAPSGAPAEPADTEQSPEMGDHSTGRG